MIIITGMHRSGTSMIAGLIDSLGVSFGSSDSFYDTDEWNPRGYFEQKDVMDVNSQLITGFRRNQGRMERLLCSALYTAMPSRARISKRGERYRDLVVSLCRKYGPGAIKDPRFCLTLSQWSSATPISGHVVCLRHPAAVVDSLWRRQNYPPWLGYRFWNYHLRSLLEQLPEDRVLFLSYDTLCSPSYARDLDQLRAFFSLDLASEEVERCYRRVFDPDLNHCESPDSALPKATRQLWAELEEHYARSLERYGPRLGAESAPADQA